VIYTLTLNPAIDRELTVSKMIFDTVLRASESRVDFGGKGLNVSRLLQQMGTASTVVGFLGGRAGEMLQDGLRTLNIAADFVWVPGETRTNVSIVTLERTHYIKVNEQGPQIGPDKQQELLDKIGILTHPGDWWVLAGSLPPGVASDFYARIVHIINQRQAYAVLDTSDEALRLGCIEKPYLVKPNLDEARVLSGLALETGGDMAAEAASAAAKIRELGAQNVIISLGKAGALLQTGKGAWLAHSPNIQEMNPIGAGDSLVGGVVWALNQNYPLKEALRWGVASGAATASLGGTEVGSRRQIETLLKKIRCESVE
jgi:1-phosphofructokinase family hexose kinase